MSSNSNVKPVPAFDVTPDVVPWNKYIGLDALSFMLTPYGKINKLNNNISVELMLSEIDAPDFNGAKFAYQVIDIQPRQEDEVICHFQAFDLMDGTPVMLPQARFGVSWAGAENTVGVGRLGVSWNTRAAEYYVPYPQLQVTPETGGYAVEVLDRDIPSEAVKFGLIKGFEGQSHTGLVIKFCLMPVRNDYPWGR